MSQTFNPGGVPPEEPSVAAADAPATGSRRNLVVIAVAVVAALGVGAYFLLFAGGGGASTPNAVVPHASLKTTSAPHASSSAHSTKGATVVKPASDKDKRGRDPFQPLLFEASATPTPTPSVAATPTTSASASTPLPSVAPSVPAAGGNVVATVALKSIKANKGSFTVDAAGVTKKYPSVAVGDTFGTFFKLYDLGSKCAQVQYGDQTGSACLGGTLILYSN
jgi:hypothetical protein